MLVLTRKKNELIQIGNQIVVKVISTGRGKVKLGIDAPANVRVLRAELANLVSPPQPAAGSPLAPR
jgi:carbon storage regulator